MEQLKVRDYYPEIDTDETMLATQMTALAYLLWIEEDIGVRGLMQGCILSDQMGLGKTRPLAYLTKINAVKVTLYITPFNTIYQVIVVFLKICKGFKCYIIEDDHAFTRVMLQENGRGLYLQKLAKDEELGRYSIIFFNKEKLNTKYKMKLIMEFSVDRLIIDEAHTFRNKNTNAYKALMSIPRTIVKINGKKVRMSSTILSTGTPVQNGLDDLSAQLNIISEGIIPPSLTREELKKVLLKYIKTNVFGRRLEDLTEEMKISMSIPLEPPTIIRVKIKFEKTDLMKQVREMSWKKIYKEYKENKSFRKNILRDEGAYITAACQKIQDVNSSNSGIDMNNLKIFLSKPYVGNIFDHRDENRMDGECKFKGKRCKDEEVLKIIRENTMSIVIFYEYIETCNYFVELLCNEFEESEISVYAIGGDDALDKRFKTLNSCNDDIESGKRTILFSSIVATCEGMNYQQFSGMIFIDQRANPQQENQAITREQRMGQKNKVHVWFIEYASFKTNSGKINVDDRLRDIKTIKIEDSTILLKNASRYFRRYTTIGNDGQRTSGVYYGDKHESKEKGSKGGPDSIGPEDIY